MLYINDLISLQICFNLLKNVRADVLCSYYPYYPYQPGSYSAYYTSCSDYCCSGYATSSYAACCSYPTTSAPWWVSLIVVGVIAIVVAIVVIFCIYKKKQQRLHPTMSFQKPVAPIAYPTLQQTTNAQLYPPPTTMTVIQDAPKFDSFMNQNQAATITNNPENGDISIMPVLPAPVAFENPNTISNKP